MRTACIVISPPHLDQLLRIALIEEPVLIQAFVAERAVEAFDMAVLHWFPGSNVVQRNSPVGCPLVQHPADELRPIIDPDARWRPTLHQQPFEHPNHARTRQRPRHLNSMTFARVCVDQGQRTKRVPRRRSVMHNVHRPLLIDMLARWEGSRPSERNALPPSPRHLQPRSPIQPVHPLVVDWPTLPPQEHGAAAIAEPGALGSQLTYVLPHIVVIALVRAVAGGGAR